MCDRSIIEGQMKYRDGKKWKPRWCVVSKLSPVADCLQLQFYKNIKDKRKMRLPKASLSLEMFIAEESGFTLDKESHTLAVMCRYVTVILAFESRERLIHWQVKLSSHIGYDRQWLVQLIATPPKSKLQLGPVKLHLAEHFLSMTSYMPPKLLHFWELKNIKRFGVIGSKFAFDGISRFGNQESGLFVIRCNRVEDIDHCIHLTMKEMLQKSIPAVGQPPIPNAMESSLPLYASVNSPTCSKSAIRNSESCYSFRTSFNSRKKNESKKNSLISTIDARIVNKACPIHSSEQKKNMNHNYDVPQNVSRDKVLCHFHRTIPLHCHISRSKSAHGLQCFFHSPQIQIPEISPKYDVPKFNHSSRSQFFPQYANIPLSLAEFSKPVYDNLPSVCCSCRREINRTQIINSEYVKMSPTVLKHWTSMPRSCSPGRSETSRRSHSVEESRLLPAASAEDVKFQETAEEVSTVAYTPGESPSHASGIPSLSSWESWNVSKGSIEKYENTLSSNREKSCHSECSPTLPTDSSLKCRKVPRCYHLSLPRCYMMNRTKKAEIPAWPDTAHVEYAVPKPTSSSSGVSDLSDAFDTFSVGSVAK